MKGAMIRGWVCLAILACALDGARGQTFDWEKVSSGGPGAFGRVAMAYDSHRGVVVVHGGDRSGGDSGGWFFNGATWEWDGRTWTKRSDSGPGLVYGAAMAYDPVRQVTVLYGGALDIDPETALTETWTWDGRDWTLASEDGPFARVHHTMTFDAALGGVLLHGGIGAPPPHYTLGASHLWDGEGWTEVAEAPPRRVYHKIVFDPAREVSWMFHGHFRPNTLETVIHKWNGGRWTPVRSGRGPRPRADYAAAYASARESVLMYGGSPDYLNEDLFDELWEWDGEGWSQLPMGTSPGGLAEANMVYDSKRDTLVLFGGKSGKDENGFIYSDGTWELPLRPAAAADWKIHR